MPCSQSQGGGLRAGNRRNRFELDFMRETRLTLSGGPSEACAYCLNTKFPCGRKTNLERALRRIGSEAPPWPHPRCRDSNNSCPADSLKRPECTFIARARSLVRIKASSEGVEVTEQALRTAEIDVCRHKLEMIRAISLPHIGRSIWFAGHDFRGGDYEQWTEGSPGPDT